MARKIVIYGGYGGIARSLGQLLEAQGVSLHLVGRDSEKLAARAKELGAGYTVGDVTDPGLYERVAREAGEVLDGLVYAVGNLDLRSLQRCTAETLLHDFQVNAVGAALAVQASLPALKRSPAVASVVFFSSVAALQGYAQHTAMSMAKGAVSGLTLALAAELAPRVRVNALAPSLTQTSLTASLLANESMAQTLATRHALQRLGTGEDIAGLAAFLLSEQAGWITGQVISVDGGRSTLASR